MPPRSGRGGEPTTSINPIYLFLGVAAVLLVIIVYSEVAKRVFTPTDEEQQQHVVDEDEEAMDPAPAHALIIRKRNRLIEDCLIIPKETIDYCSPPFSCQQQGGGGNPPAPQMECQICMEEFQAGERVALSANCDHVHHFECIRQWLLKKDDCPSCRQSMLFLTTTATKEESYIKKKKSVFFYCKQHGIQQTSSGRGRDELLLLDDVTLDDEESEVCCKDTETSS